MPKIRLNLTLKHCKSMILGFISKLLSCGYLLYYPKVAGNKQLGKLTTVLDIQFGTTVMIQKSQDGHLLS